MTLKKGPYKNFVERGENASNQHFLLFPQCFLFTPPKKKKKKNKQKQKKKKKQKQKKKTKQKQKKKTNKIFLVTCILLSANAFNFDQSKDYSLVKS